jgi:hypothetical protein
MNKSSIRTLPAALALAFASIGLSAVAQTQPAPATQEPTMIEKAKETGKEAVDATKRTAKKAGTATKKVAKKTGDAVSTAGHKTADGMRTAGKKIGEKVPGTAEHDAAKKP